MIDQFIPQLERYTYQIYHYVEAVITSGYNFDFEHTIQVLELYLDIMYMVVKADKPTVDVGPTDLGSEVMSSGLIE